MKYWRFKNILLPLLLLLAAAFLSLYCGKAPVDWQNIADDAIFELRLIRVLAAFTAGASLSLAGLIFQAVLRNVLAEPFTLGISGGASVGAALAIIFQLHVFTVWAIPLMASAGALITLLTVLFMASGKGAESMLLSGVIAGTCASSLLMYLVSTADQHDLAGITWWMLGDLQAADSNLLIFSLTMTAASTLVCYLGARELNALAMGGEYAWSLGTNVRLFQTLFIGIGSLLAAQTIAMTGMIAFVGLIVPHLVRRICGSDHRRIVLTTVLCGGGFLMLCDLLSRTIHPQHELPIGVLTAAVGGGSFIYILNRHRRNRQ